MSGKLFIFDSNNPNVSIRVVVSADAGGLAELIRALRRLRCAEVATVHVGSLPAFEAINFADLIFTRSTASRINLSRSELLIEATDDRLKKYCDLIDVLIASPGGHQYLDADTRNVDVGVLVSSEEYQEEFIEKLKADRHKSS